jgi:hypothetical protein
MPSEGNGVISVSSTGPSCKAYYSTMATAASMSPHPVVTLRHPDLHLDYGATVLPPTRRRYDR